MCENESCWILMGGNHSSTNLLFEKALSEMNINQGQVLRVGSIFASDSWGYKSEFQFLNQLVELSTPFSAIELLKKLQKLESDLGREKREAAGYYDRKIDLDIMYFGQHIINQKNIQIPHPRLQLRKFALEPLAEMIPHFVHPILKKANSTLLQECPDHSIVKRI